MRRSKEEELRALEILDAEKTDLLAEVIGLGAKDLDVKHLLRSSAPERLGSPERYNHPV